MLRSVDFSDTSRIVTFLTPDRGRLACIAKGARRPRSPLAPALDTFNRVELVYYWKDGRDVHPLAEAALLDGFDGIKSQLEKVAYASFPLELAYKVARENEPSQRLYAMLVRGFETLAHWRGDVRTQACWHVVHLLAAAGFEPAVDQCAQCGADASEARGFSFAGGVTCPACRGDRRLEPDDLAALRALKRSANSCPEHPVSREVFHMLRQYAVRQLESEFRSIRVIDQMFGAAGGRAT